jgi:hypothetical protein
VWVSSVVFGLVQGAENWGEQRGVFYRVLKVWVSNIILFIVLFFCTSPAYLISQLETLPFLNPKTIQGSVLHLYSLHLILNEYGTVLNILGLWMQTN